MGKDPALEQMLRDFYRGTAEIEARNIRVGQELGILRACDPIVAAYAHIGMVERVLLTLLESPEAFPDPPEVIRQLIQLAYVGLTSGPSPSPAGTSRDPNR
jgi:hypothetical protein